uniref:Uncharacterized protein n=1 Tax=Myotis myotis TaxID=51298 RepID=A0A7J7V3E7_MYOMY|nr:hypothetical protein mMyoMyo1_008446 [Myotis myotis]
MANSLARGWLRPLQVSEDDEVSDTPDPRQPLRLGFLCGPWAVSGCAPPASERITTERDAPAESPARGPPRRHRRGPAIRNLAETRGTDAVLSTMMSCTCSVYSWDNVVRRVGSKLLFDQKYWSKL